MENRNSQRNVAGPVVRAEIVESMMRPRAVGAIAEGHEQSEEHVEGDGADGGEADVCGEMQDGDVCGQHELEILSFAQVHQFDVRVGHFVYKNANSAAIEGLAVQSSAAQLATQKAAHTEGCARITGLCKPELLDYHGWGRPRCFES